MEQVVREQAKDRLFCCSRKPPASGGLTPLEQVFGMTKVWMSIDGNE